jgi:integrase/recombinase XerC/integrase/recombinase XerD
MKKTSPVQRRNITMPTLQQAVSNYLTALSLEGKSSEYTDWLYSRLKVFTKFCLDNQGQAKINSLTIETGRAFIKHLMERKVRYTDHKLRHEVEGGLAPTTVHGYVRALRSFSTWVYEEGHTDENGFDGIRPPKVPQTLINPLTEDEIRKLLLAVQRDTVEGQRNYAIILMFLDTGVRLSELINLKLEDVNFGVGQFKVFGKGAKERLVPLGQTAKRALIRYLEQARPEPVNPAEERVFLTAAGLPISKDSVEKIIQRLAKRTGITRLHPHLFRHTFAIRYLVNGGDVFTLQKILGHASLDMTRKYVTLANADVKEKHILYSPVDHLGLAEYRRGRPRRKMAQSA